MKPLGVPVPGVIVLDGADDLFHAHDPGRLGEPAAAQSRRQQAAGQVFLHGVHLSEGDSVADVAVDPGESPFGKVMPIAR